MGNNVNGRLGIGNKTMTYNNTPCLIEISGKARIQRISSGWAHTAALTENGEVLTWGLGQYGALGHGDIATQYKPKMIDILIQKGVFIKEIDAGTRHTAFVSHDGHLFSCGNGDAGQLGTGNRDTELFPVKAKYSGVDVCNVSCGIFHTLFLTCT